MTTDHKQIKTHNNNNNKRNKMNNAMKKQVKISK